MFSVAKAAEQRGFQDGTKQKPAGYRGGQGQPEAAGEPGDDIGEVGTDHEQAAMGEVDHPHNPENQRQPAADEKQQQAVLEAVEELREEGGHVPRYTAILHPVPGSASASAAGPITLFSPLRASRSQIV